MRLKRLELFGFKSFADRSVLDFQHSLVGVVGPNGCGKSNVVDAIRWVLGEQRPTSMRGGEMIDVIFKGSASRPPLSVAEASLVFENSDGILEGHGEEVSVTRRVYRSGEGEYLIDGDRVRLKDVREMLFGTGLGSRGYSALEQGKIDAILSANPLERRAIFEEAAGISRYRQRKKETESRLKRVEADLQRLDDVVGELQRRQRSLKIQAGRARRFVEARDAWRIDGERLARHQMFSLSADIADRSRALRELEREVEERRARRGSAEEDVTTRENEQAALSAELDRLGEESAELGAEVRGLDERRTQLGSRVSAWRAAAEEERQRAEDLDRRLAARRLELDDLTLGRTELGRFASEAQERARVLAQEVQELTADHARIHAEVERNNEEVLELLHRRTTDRNERDHTARSMAALGERLERARARRTSEEEELSNARVSAELSEVDLGERLQALEGLETELAREEADGAGRQAEVTKNEARHAELELELARLSTRVESLVDWEREREGLEAGARELVGALEEGRGPTLEGELAGLLADHLRVDTETARALDAALGERARSLVLRSPDDARTVLSWLKEERRGRVALVLPGGPERELAPPAELLAEDGVEGRLVDETCPDQGYESVARALLGDVVLVRDVTSALAFVRRFPGLRFVTRAGDLVDAAGVSGGHVEVVQGAVGRRSVAAELEAERARSADELERTRTTLERARSERDACALRRGALRERIERESEARSEARSAFETARARLEDLLRAAELSDHELGGLERERTELDRRHTGAVESLEHVEESHTLAVVRLEELEEQRRALEGERGQRARDEAQARVESTTLVERLEAASRRETDLTHAVEEADGERARARRLVKEHLAHAEEGEAEIERLAEARDELLERRGVVEERIRTVREHEREGRDAIEALRRRGEALTGELEGLLTRVADERLEVQRLELSREDVGRRAEEDLGLARAELLSDFQPEPELSTAPALEALAASVHELRERMDALGPVNLEAVTELDEVDQRLGFLLEQRSDLADARRSLDGTLKKLETESERLFVESFTQIRENFKVIFRQLFGGGKADVTLAEDEPVLEAGIEITARPPGRETLPISLLSGGQRSMTALALLFAVFRAHPSPFCILDEVDAALDDANIGRFLGMLRHSLDQTQFVIVTHNKGTMAACEMLYGVTMAVRGVSHLVRVELSDVDDFVPDAGGRGRSSAEPASDTAAEGTPDPGDKGVLVPQPRGGAEVQPAAGEHALGAPR